MNNASFKKQSGAVLVMALVMLAVLTLIGVASMESSSIELKIASNTQEYKIAFQSAQTMIAFLTSDEVMEDSTDPFYINYHDVSGVDQTIELVDYPYSAATGTAASAIVKHVGCSAGIGDSLEEGKGQKFNFYDARVTGYNKIVAAQASSTSVQVQGVRYFAAGC